jgi:hypothetical protein
VSCASHRGSQRPRPAVASGLPASASARSTRRRRRATATTTTRRTRARPGGCARRRRTRRASQRLRGSPPRWPSLPRPANPSLRTLVSLFNQRLSGRLALAERRARTHARARIRMGVCAHAHSCTRSTRSRQSPLAALCSLCAHY